MHGMKRRHLLHSLALAPLLASGLNRASAFHLSLGLDYPQQRHREAARRQGVDPGGDIMIHGQPDQVPDGFRVKGDWTAGCIAVKDGQMEEVYSMVRVGTPIMILP